MKKILTIALLTIVSTFAVFAQNEKDEQEIMKIHRSLDQAFLNKDTAAFERVMADDYIMSGTSGKMQNRAQTLEDMRKEFADAKYKVLSATTDDVKVKVSGNMAMVTGNWTMTTASNAAGAEAHKDMGRFTNIYEKRGGKWMLVAEHWSEAQHDRKLMEQQVLKMGQQYTEMIKRGNVSELETILADDYIYTNEKGAVRNKAEDLATYKNGPIFDFTETTDQKVRVLGNSAAVETGVFRYKGKDKDGKPIEGSDRYTTVWVWRDGRWQIAADHTSEIK